MNAAAASRTREHIVQIADMKVCAKPGDRLITYALGSCIGFAVHDPAAGFGGLLHVMLPLSTVNPQKALENPCMFVDTGVPLLFRECYKAGADKGRIVVKVAGGAHTGENEEADRFQIGKRNILTLRKLLRRNGVPLRAQDVGGFQTSRTMSLEIGSGDVILKINGSETSL